MLLKGIWSILRYSKNFDIVKSLLTTDDFTISKVYCTRYFCIPPFILMRNTSSEFIFFPTPLFPPSHLFLSVSVLWHAIEAKDRNYTTAAMYSNSGGGSSGGLSKPRARAMNKKESRRRGLRSSMTGLDLPTYTRYTHGKLLLCCHYNGR